MDAFRKLDFRLWKARQTPDHNKYNKPPSDAPIRPLQVTNSENSSGPKGPCSTGYPPTAFDPAFPQIPPLDLKTTEETRRDEEYLFSAFNSNSTRIDNFRDETLLEIFNIDLPLQVPGYTSSRLVGIDVPRILGLAPSLESYHTLWRFRYTLEIQLTYLWGEFQARFSWARITDQAIRAVSLDTEINVIRELWCLLRLTKNVLSSIYHAKPTDCMNCHDFILAEVAGLGRDIEVYKEKLRTCLGKLEQGDYYIESPGVEVWEKDVYKKPVVTSDTYVYYSGEEWGSGVGGSYMG